MCGDEGSRAAPAVSQGPLVVGEPWVCRARLRVAEDVEGLRGYFFRSVILAGVFEVFPPVGV